MSDSLNPNTQPEGTALPDVAPLPWPIRHLQGLRVLVLGLGDSGLAMADWCARGGAQVRVWDSRPQPPQAGALRERVPQATVLTGALDEALLRGEDAVQWVLKSPGLAPHDAAIAPLLAAARASGIAIGGELDLFARALAELKATLRYTPRVLAITGTNGKTTTTSMTGQLVQRCGLRTAVAGNIGPTLLDTLSAALEPELLALARSAAQAADEADNAAAIPAAASAGPVRDEPATDASGADDPAAEDTATQGAVPQDAAQAPTTDDPVTDEPAAPAATEDDDEAPLQLAPPPPPEAVFAHLPQVWVLELSSFQLDGVQGFQPDAAAVLNITQDHLDWHGDMAAYAAAKARIYGAGIACPTVMVVNRDDPQVMAMVPAPMTVKSERRGQRARVLSRRSVAFGLQAPERPGDFGLVVEHGMAWLVRAREADETLRSKTGRRMAANTEPDEIQLQRLMPADALRIRGRHNAANALAALALATAIGCPLAPMLHGLREYRGEPHRVEPVGSVGGIEAYDDSKGTNVGATLAALDGLGADTAPSQLVVILGGDGKGQDFRPLAPALARHVRAVALIGRDAPLIAGQLADVLATRPHARHDSLPAAVAWCFEQARPGDAVLLSPACASLDMFRHYAHRAEVFVQAVHDLAAERGETI